MERLGVVGRGARVRDYGTTYLLCVFQGPEEHRERERERERKRVERRWDAAAYGDSSFVDHLSCGSAETIICRSMGPRPVVHWRASERALPSIVNALSRSHHRGQ